MELYGWFAHYVFLYFFIVLFIPKRMSFILFKLATSNIYFWHYWKESSVKRSIFQGKNLNFMLTGWWWIKIEQVEFYLTGVWLLDSWNVYWTRSHFSPIQLFDRLQVVRKQQFACKIFQMYPRLSFPDSQFSECF